MDPIGPEAVAETPPETTEKPSKWRRRAVTIGKWTLIVVVTGLAAIKVYELVTPSPAVGYWRSQDKFEAYQQSYDELLATLPATDDVIDVPTSFGTVHVLRWEGADPGPPVVLLPGRGAGGMMWSENLPDWIGQRTVYAVDPIGDAGFSNQRVPLTGFEDQADWIAETLDGLGVEQAHVVGHSFGGANAAIFAVRYPEKVATLTLLEPVIVIDSLPISTYFWSTLTLLPVPQSWQDRALAEIGGTTTEEVQEGSPLAVMLDLALSNYPAALPLPEKLSDDQWRSLTMPVRVDIAGKQSLAGGESGAKRIESLLPEAIVTVWPEATHSLPMQEKATLDPQLLAFWDEND